MIRCVVKWVSRHERPRQVAHLSLHLVGIHAVQSNQFSLVYCHIVKINCNYILLHNEIKQTVVPKKIKQNVIGIHNILSNKIKLERFKTQTLKFKYSRWMKVWRDRSKNEPLTCFYFYFIIIILVLLVWDKYNFSSQVYFEPIKYIYF